MIGTFFCPEEKLWALHTNNYDYAQRRPDLSKAAVEARQRVFASTVYETEHPVVRVHPETGEKTLLLGGFVKKILGVSATESAHLYQLFQSHITSLENTVRWHWKVGDVAVWNNRATQYIAVNDYGTERRVMRRVTLAGDVPVSVDGKHSVTTLKVPLEAAGLV
ncbi:MAG: TauD/TfdA family dioxygenase [Alicyclobacillus sp.]|nr:TauD/TfdA family dioxygenase [Alicyclobacillus sp.]